MGNRGDATLFFGFFIQQSIYKKIWNFSEKNAKRELEFRIKEIMKKGIALYCDMDFIVAVIGNILENFTPSLIKTRHNTILSSYFLSYYMVYVVEIKNNEQKC